MEFAVAKRQVGYLIFYKRNVEVLRERVEQLRFNRERIQQMVEAARHDGSRDQISSEVRLWLDAVGQAIAEAEEFHQEAALAEGKFCNSPFLSYRLSKTAKMMTSYATKLLGNRGGLFSKIYRQVDFSMFERDFNDFGSRMMIFQEMKEALYDDNINVIGVCGMPEMGKTTLVKQVSKRANEHSLFDAVVVVSVTQNPNVSRIQGEIAGMLGLRLSEESPRERADQICERLKKAKKVFIILDDVWEHLDLVEIGIPSANDQGIVKIVVISRYVNVLQQMEAQKNFEIKPLPQNEAVSWFLDNSGITDDADHLYGEVAMRISNICMGLPSLLVRMAMVLRHKGLYEWKEALQRVELFYDDNFATYILSAMESSINHLESHEVKMTLLLCAALGEEIFSEQMVKLCLGWGFFQHNETVEEAASKLVRWVQSLQASCLLQDGRTIRHDFIRKVTLRIAFKEYNIFVVEDGNRDRNWPHDKALIQNFTAIFLLGEHEGELPQRLVCPKLELLYVYDESQTLAIQDNFFERINKGLQVLSLNNMKLLALPSSICVLTSIQTLCLDKCELQDIALLGKLVTLKVLSLSGSNIKQLPYQIRYLVNLWLLDLDNCSKLESIPAGVISNLTRLQELLLPNSFNFWKHSEVYNDERTDASLGELSHLNDMKALQIHIPDIKVVPRDFPWHILERYSISVGQVQGQWSSRFERKLQLNHGIDIDVYDWVKPLLMNSEELWIKDLKGFKSILNLHHEVFQELKYLHLQDIAEMEWLVNSDYIINNEYGGSRIFENLQTLVVKRCNSFQSLVFPSSCLHTLTKLEISKCMVLEEIIVIKGEGDILEKMLFTCLKSFVLESLPELSTFCQEEFEFPSAEKISIINCPKLKTFPQGLSMAINHFLTNQGSFEKLQKLHNANLDRLDLETWNKTMSSKSLCELQELEFGQCGELLSIIPSSLLNKMQKLKKCTVRACDLLNSAFDTVEGNQQNEELLPLLEEFVLTDLPLMECLWKQEPRIPIFKNLVFLEFVRCSSLKTLFSIPVAKNLEQLVLLKLYQCEKMEHVLEGEAGSEKKVLVFKKLKHLILMHLPKLLSFCEEDCDFKLPELEIVRVKDIPKMETFAKGTHQTPKLKEFYITYVSNCWKGDLNKTIEYLHDYPGAENAGHMKVEHTQLKPQTVTDSSEGDDSAIVPPSFLEQEESNKGVAQEGEDLITEVLEEAVTLADCHSQTMSCREEKVSASDIVDDGQLEKVVADNHVEEILAACERRPGFLPACSNVLRQVLLRHPILAVPFRERSSHFAVMSYELLANVLLVLEERNPSKMSDADFSALLMQLEELKILGFDHSWVDSLRHRVTTLTSSYYSSLERRYIYIYRDIVDS